MPTASGALLAATAETRDVDAVASAVAGTLRSWIGVGPVFLASADPDTGAFTSTYTFDIPDAAAAAFYANEQTGRDVVAFRDLSRAVHPTGSLFDATGGRPQASARWREVIEPLGWGDELRAAARADGATWGYLCLHRAASERAFTARDVSRLAALLPVLAGVLRRTALGAATEPLDTGVLLVGMDGQLIGATGAGEAWLAECGAPALDRVPLLMAGLARHVLDTGTSTTCTITTRTGRAGVLEVAPLRGEHRPRAVVVISAASARHQLRRFATAAGLTARERQVLECVERGLDTRTMADELAVAPATVQAHLTAIFGKTGLRSRRELLSRLRA